MENSFLFQFYNIKFLAIFEVPQDLLNATWSISCHTISQFTILEASDIELFGKNKNLVKTLLIWTEKGCLLLSAIPCTIFRQLSVEFTNLMTKWYVFHQKFDILGNSNLQMTEKMAAISTIIRIRLRSRFLLKNRFREIFLICIELFSKGRFKIWIRSVYLMSTYLFVLTTTEA